jgi:hypothetical protein
MLYRLLSLLSLIWLILRVINQKRRRQQIVSWRKQRRMTLQSLGMSSLYLFGWLPTLIIVLMQQLGPPTLSADIQTDYAFDLIYFIYLLLP